MRVLHVTPSFMPAVRYGGPIVTVLRLCQELQRAGVELSIATTNADGSGVLPVPTDRSVDVGGLSVRYFNRHGRLDYAFAPGLAEYVWRAARNYDLVHITSVFSFPALIAGIAARRSGVPYVVSPHGALQAWSLRQKRWKKAPYWWFLERPHLMKAAGIHACAGLEEEEIRLALPSARIFVVPNGSDAIDVPRVERRPRRVVFLGRIHQKKGFDVLVPALARVARYLPDVETVVAGPNEGGEWERVQALIDEANPRPRVTYLGSVNGAARFDLLASAAVFVLPSHSENFGMAVVEALACGTPVVVSQNCPWECVEQERAGYWVKNTAESVAEGLLAILNDPEGAVRMGVAAQRIAARFQWPAVARQMIAAYEGILREGTRP